jgi:hypothetical protein
MATSFCFPHNATTSGPIFSKKKGLCTLLQRHFSFVSRLQNFAQNMKAFKEFMGFLPGFKILLFGYEIESLN